MPGITGLTTRGNRTHCPVLKTGVFHHRAKAPDEGFEPPVDVLETPGLAVNRIWEKTSPGLPPGSNGAHY